MEGLEIHPVSTRTVCLNILHLKPWWVTQGLSAALSCFYNPHQPQIIWNEVSIPLPTPRILKIKGHASHALPSRDTPVLKTDIQMGTYLLFHIPHTEGCVSPSRLVLNGVQSVVRGKKNPSLFSLHLLMEDQRQPSPTDEEGSASNGWTGITSPRKAEGFVARRRPITEGGESVGASVEDFGGVEEVTTLVDEGEEGEDACPPDPDSDDASEDIHKIVLRRLVIDITVLMRRWEQIKTEDNLMILLLKPEQRLQAWQFLTSWISVRERERGSDEGATAPTLTRRKVITRPKQPVSSPSTLTNEPATTPTKG